MGTERKRVRVARSFSELQELKKDSNKEIADQLREEAQRVERSDSFAGLFMGKGCARLLLTGAEGEDDTAMRCVFSLIEVESRLRELEYGEVTIRVHDGMPVLVLITETHKPGNLVTG